MFRGSSEVDRVILPLLAAALAPSTAVETRTIDSRFPTAEMSVILDLCPNQQSLHRAGLFLSKVASYSAGLIPTEKAFGMM